MTTIKTAAELLKENVIVKHYAGSRAYGTALPTSDTDFRGTFCAAPINVRTPFYRIGESKDVTEEDTVFYELAFFMKLVLDCNPNVIETLWVDSGDIVAQHPSYALLREAAPKLLSSKIAFTTTGYAKSQLERIKGHNKWITNPQPEARPQQVDFVSLVHNFSDEKVFKLNLRELHEGYRIVPYSGDCFGVYKCAGGTTFDVKDGSLNPDYDGMGIGKAHPLFIGKFNREVWTEAKVRWEQYWEWKKNRNAARSALEEQFGYDTKHAMHLVRLLRMGVEVLETGQILVRRPDAKELLEIRAGKWTYEEVIEYGEHMNARVMELYKQCTLPKRPDIKLAAKLIMEVQDLIWQGTHNTQA